MSKKQNKIPLVSIIIPVFNVESYVGQCLSSIHKQTYRNLEIIVVNDGSTDESLRICQEWAKRDNRIKIINEENSGLSVARNVGLSYSTGQYVSFVDSDDWIAERAIETMIRAFHKYDADMVTCQFYIYNGTPHINFESSEKVKILNRTEYVQKLLMAHEITDHIWRKMFKKELMPRRPFWEGHMFEDMVAMPVLVSRCKRFVSLSDPLYYYRARSDSFIHTPSRSNIVEHYISTKESLRLYQELNLGTSEELAGYGFWRYWTAFCDMKRFNVTDKKLGELLIKEIRKYPICQLSGRAKVICLAIKIMPLSANVLCKFV